MRLMIYALLALAPMPFASARPTWQWMWVAFVGLLVLVHLGRNWKHPVPSHPRAISASMGLVLVFVAWGFFQAFAGVGATHDFGSPLVNQELVALGTISIAPQKTMTTTMGFFSHLAFFGLVFAYASRRVKTVHLIRFCGIVVALYAGYGFISFVSGNEYVLWYRREPFVNSLTSSFINRNSFAAFAGLGLQCLLAYAYFWMQDELAERRTGRELVRHVLETLLAKAWWLPLAIILTAIAILLTNSRAGFATATAATVLLLLMSPNKYQRSKTIWKPLIQYSFFAAIAVGLFWLSGDLLESRLQQNVGFDFRFKIYPIVMDIVAEQPLTGFGLGTFEDLFRMHQDFLFDRFMIRAHNDYLELAMSAGIPATVLIVLAPVILVVFLVRRLRFGAQYRAFIALGITSSLQIGLHSLVDFPLQIPAISYLWCAILASSVALAYRCELAAKSAANR